LNGSLEEAELSIAPKTSDALQDRLAALVLMSFVSLLADHSEALYRKGVTQYYRHDGSLP